jgi:hypothetical protein
MHYAALGAIFLELPSGAVMAIVFNSSIALVP